MRQIEQMVAVLLHVAGLKKLKQYDAAIQYLRQSSRRLTGFDLDMLRRIPAANGIALLETAGRLDIGKCLILAEILKEDGEMSEALGDKDIAWNSYDRSLSYFLEALLLLPKNDADVYLDKVNFLTGKLKGEDFTEARHLQLFQFLESMEHYAQAENHLFFLVEAGVDGIREAGIAFCRRLLEKDDAALRAGNLPREEVLEALAQLSR